MALALKIHSATGVPLRGMFGSTDAYVKVECGKECRTTPPCRVDASRTVRWETDLVVTIPDTENTFVLSMMNRTLLLDNTIFSVGVEIDRYGWKEGKSYEAFVIMGSKYQWRFTLFKPKKNQLE